MSAYRLKAFTGGIPKLDPRLLPDFAARDATNVFLTSGRLDPMLEPLDVASARSGDVQSIYRMYDDTNSVWLNWSEQVDVAESPVFVENGFRICFASPDFEPRQTDLALASSGSPYPGAWYVLGVTPPITKPTVSSVTGGSGTPVSRSYVYTFVTTWGEESAPSPAATIFNGTPDGTWNLSIPDVAPPNVYNISATTWAAGKLRLTVDSVFGLRAKERILIAGLAPVSLNNSFRVDSIDTVNKYVYIVIADPGTITDGAGTATRQAPHNTTGMTKRVYRSITTAEGTDFFLVGDNIAVATTTFADNVTVIGEPIPTTGWAMPPANLEGLVVHPSGSMAGFVGNDLYLSEPYAPYAWQIANILTLDFKIVGIGQFSQSLVVGTEGRPYVVTFADVSAASAQKVDEAWPCLSKRGVVSFSNGVYFPTNLGLAYVGNSGTQLITKEMYSQRDWAAVQPSTFNACQHDNRYYAVYEVDNQRQILVISPTEGVSNINLTPGAIFADREDGQVYIAFNAFVSRLNGHIGFTVPFSWVSKEIVLNNPENLGAAKIDFDSQLDIDEVIEINNANADIAALNATIFAGDIEGSVDTMMLNSQIVNDDDLLTPLSLAGIRYLSFTLFADNELVFNKEVVSNAIFRLPAGKKYSSFWIQISGTAAVKSVLIGGTPMELKNV